MEEIGTFHTQPSSSAPRPLVGGEACSGEGEGGGRSREGVDLRVELGLTCMGRRGGGGKNYVEVVDLGWRSRIGEEQ